MNVAQPEARPARRVSPIQLSDGLIQLARDAEDAGLPATAAVLLGMAKVVLEPETRPKREPWR